MRRISRIISVNIRANKKYRLKILKNIPIYEEVEWKNYF